jgi:hypothetical protein
MIAVLMIMAAGGHGLLRLPEGPPPGAAPTLERIQQLQQLVIQRVVVSEIHETRVAGCTGGMEVTVVVRGDVLVSVDLQRARILSQDEGRRELILELPLPGVLSPRLDHDQTYVQHVAFTGLWQIVPSTDAQTLVVDRTLREAQAAVANAGAASELVTDAEIRTQRIMSTWAKSVGWNIQVCWSTNR